MVVLFVDLENVIVFVIVGGENLWWFVGEEDCGEGVVVVD